jgi:hypothetical protein
MKVLRALGILVCNLQILRSGTKEKRKVIKEIFVIGKEIYISGDNMID